MTEQFDITLRSGFKGAKKRLVHRKENPDTAWYYLGLVGQIGFVIALPIAGGAIVGSWLHGTLIGIGIGFLISIVGFVRIVQKIMQTRK